MLIAVVVVVVVAADDGWREEGSISPAAEVNQRNVAPCSVYSVEQMGAVVGVQPMPVGTQLDFPAVEY